MQRCGLDKKFCVCARRSVNKKDVPAAVEARFFFIHDLSDATFGMLAGGGRLESCSGRKDCPYPSAPALRL